MAIKDGESIETETDALQSDPNQRQTVNTSNDLLGNTRNRIQSAIKNHKFRIIAILTSAVIITVGYFIISSRMSRKHTEFVNSVSNSASPFNLKKYEIDIKLPNNVISTYDTLPIFQYVKGLSKTFEVEQPTLFKTTIQGGILDISGIIRATLQMVVNDHVIAADTLIPNKAEALNDGRFQFGSYVYGNGQAIYVVPVTRISHVYLQPGTYTFNVGIICSEAPIKLEFPMVTYELMQFKDTNLKEIGGLKLTTITN